MKGLVYGNQQLTYREDLPIPKREENESLIKIRLAALCSTDKEILKGYRPDFKGVMGHEFVGTVEESNDDLLKGKRVVGEINAGCGKCLYCRTGREKHCLHRKTIGIVDKDGCFAEYMTLRTNLLHLVPEKVSDEEAVCTEPLAAALEILQRKHIGPDCKVCVIGDGRLSFMIAQVVALNGAEVVVLGHHEEKLKRFSSFATPLKETDETFELVIDASGSPSGLDTAKRVCRKGGTIVLKSTYERKFETNLSWIAVDEITLMGSRCGPFRPALRLIADKKIILPRISLFPLSKWREAFESRAFKVGFDMRK